MSAVIVGRPPSNWWARGRIGRIQATCYYCMRPFWTLARSKADTHRCCESKLCQAAQHAEWKARKALRLAEDLLRRARQQEMRRAQG